MSDSFDFDSSLAFDEPEQIAREQENRTRALLIDRVTKKASADSEYKRLLIENPEQVIQDEAGTLSDASGQQIDVGSGVVKEVTEITRKTFSSALPEIKMEKVEELVFNTIEDIRKSFNITLRLSQVLFYAGLGMVVAAFIVALASDDEQMVSLLFGAGGMVSMLISALVSSSLDRVQKAAGDLVQLQMAYLAYYKQLVLLGGTGADLSTEDAIQYSKEIDRAANSLINAVEKNIEAKISNSIQDTVNNDKDKADSKEQSNKQNTKE